MNRLRALGHIAVTDLRHAWRSTLVALVVLAVAATTLSLALVLRAQAEEPWQRSFDRAQGPHVVASAASKSVLEALVAQPEVQAGSAITRETFGTLHTGDHVLLVRLVEAPTAPSTVDQPLWTAGQDARSGAVVVESTAAARLGLRIGDRLGIGAASARPGAPPVVDGSAAVHDLQVGGIARIVSQSPFPGTQPALLRISSTDLDTATRGEATGWTVGVRLEDPEGARAFADRARGGGGVNLVQTWQDERDEALDGVRTQQAVLGSFALLLLLVAAAAIATLVSARVVASARRTALLRTLGVTPREARALHVAQQVALAMVAALTGCAAAVALAPRVIGPSAAALGVQARLPAATTVLVVVLVLVVVAAVSGLLATRSASRSSTITALDNAVSSRAFGSSGLGGRADRAGLGIAAVLGLRSLAARPQRTLLAATGIALSAAAAVACAGMDATLARERSAAGAVSATVPGFLPATGSEGLRPVAYALLVLLAVLSVGALVATNSSTLTETSHDDATLAALGMTPRQNSLRTAWAATALAAGAATAGLPLGVLLLQASYSAANGSTDGLVSPSLSAYPLVLVTTVVVVVTATSWQAARARSSPPGLRLRRD